MPRKQKSDTKKSTVRSKPKASSSAPKRAKTKKSRAKTGVTPPPMNAAQSRAQGVHCFWVNDGPVVCGLVDLRDALRDMSDEQYAHHTTGRNDFANWVRDVFDDMTCAFVISGAMHRDDAIEIIDNILSEI